MRVFAEQCTAKLNICQMQESPFWTGPKAVARALIALTLPSGIHAPF
jgi:hypothetical protein